MGTRRCVTSFPYLTVTKPDLSPSDISPCEAEKLRGPEARPHQKLHQGDIPQVAAPMDSPQEPAQLPGREGPGPEALSCSPSIPSVGSVRA